MNKITYYGKRQSGPSYPYNYNHNYNGYTGYPYKKNYFKNRQKINNPPISNNYFEERKKNYYYNNSFNNFNDGFNSYHTIFQKKYHFNRYTPYFTEEKKIEEEINNDSVNEEEKKEEILKIKINVRDNQCKELVLCKGDNINEKVVEFCKDNCINEKLVEPLCNKVNQSLSTLEIINNSNLALNKNDFLILNKVKNITGNNENN